MEGKVNSAVHRLTSLSFLGVVVPKDKSATGRCEECIKPCFEIILAADVMYEKESVSNNILTLTLCIIPTPLS